MSHEAWKGRACSGIPKNVSGSIKRDTWQHLMFAKAHLADLTIQAFVAVARKLLHATYQRPELARSQALASRGTHDRLAQSLP